MSSLANAIATAEGYGVPGAIPTLANNPGDLVLGNQGYGVMGNGITVFPTVQSGYDALNNQIGLIQSGQSAVYSQNESIAQIGNTWSGGNPAWANNVASSLGVSPSTPVSQIASPNSTPSLWSSISGALGSLTGSTQLGPGPIGSVNGQPLQAAATPSSFSASRIAAGLIGLICIAGGVFALKSTQSLIVNTTGVAAKAAKKAAEVTA